MWYKHASVIPHIAGALAPLAGLVALAERKSPVRQCARAPAAQFVALSSFQNSSYSKYMFYTTSTSVQRRALFIVRSHTTAISRPRFLLHQSGNIPLPS